MMNSQSFKHLVRSKAEWGGRMDLNIWCHSLQNSLHAQTLTLRLSRIRSTAVDLSVAVVTAAASSATNCCFVIQSKKKKNLSSSKSFFFSFTISAKIFQQLQQESKFWWSLLWKNFTSPSHGLRIQRSRRNIFCCWSSRFFVSIRDGIQILSERDFKAVFLLQT